MKDAFSMTYVVQRKKIEGQIICINCLKGSSLWPWESLFWTYGLIEYCLESLLGYIVCLELVSFKEKRGEKQQMNDKCKVCNDQSYRLEAVLFKQYLPTVNCTIFSKICKSSLEDFILF